MGLWKSLLVEVVSHVRENVLNVEWSPTGDRDRQSQSGNRELGVIDAATRGLDVRIDRALRR